jgi:cell division protein FtsN
MSRAVVALAALGLAAATGYATWSLSSSDPEPGPGPETSLAALAAQPAEGDEGATPSAAEDDGFEDESTVPTADGEDSADLAEGEVSSADGDEPSTSSLEPSTDGHYFVQVASYKDAMDAKDSMEALVGRGMPAETILESGSSWHKVRLGPYPTRADAEKARFDLDLTQRRAAYVLPRSNGKFHVQVGSFASRKDAEPLAERLTSRGHTTKISRIKMGSKRWHCVRIGPFDTYDEAKGYLGLVDVPGSKARVIPFAPEE